MAEYFIRNINERNIKLSFSKIKIQLKVLNLMQKWSYNMRFN